MTQMIETPLVGDLDNIVIGMVIARAWRDQEFQARFVESPKDVLTEEGLDCPEGAEVRVLVDTAEVQHIIMEPGTTKTAQALAGMAGTEIKLVQNSPQLRYVVIPLPPEEPQAIPEGELARIAYAKSGTNVAAVSVAVVVNGAAAISAVGAAAVAVAVIFLT